jgi:5-methylcytosine-specific restriction endonuclease McrA
MGARPRSCKVCGKGTPRRLAYCSPQCQRVAKPYPPTLVLTCTCGAIFKRRKKLPKSGRAYCSQKCARSAANLGSESTLYRGGSKIGRGPGWKQIAAKIRDRDGHQCRRCGRTRAENGDRTLVVDHVIPYRSFSNPTSANQESNLVTLCEPCHSWKTSTIEIQWLRGDVIGMQEFQKWVQGNAGGKR